MLNESEKLRHRRAQEGNDGPRAAAATKGFYFNDPSYLADFDKKQRANSAGDDVQVEEAIPFDFKNATYQEIVEENERRQMVKHLKNSEVPSPPRLFTEPPTTRKGAAAQIEDENNFDQVDWDDVPAAPRCLTAGPDRP